MKVPGLSWDEAAGEELAWRPTRVPGVSWLPLHLAGTEGSGGAARGGAAVLVRMLPGCGYTPHRHLGTEDVLVLAGGYRDQWGSHTAGDHVHYPAGSEHAPRALGSAARPTGPDNPACVLYSVVPEGIELLEPRPCAHRRP